MKKKKLSRKKELNNDIEYFPTFTDSTSETRTLNLILDKTPTYWREQMKNIIIDIFVAGAVLYVTNSVYCYGLELVQLRDITLIDYLLVGYTSFRLTNFLRK